MRCPLIKKVEQVASATLEVGVADCIKEECAWWDEEELNCDPSGIRHQLKALIAQLWTLTKKMPKDFTPRG